MQLPKAAIAYIRLKAELNKVSVEKQIQLEVMETQNTEFEDMHHAYEYLELSSFKQAYAEIREDFHRT